MKKIFLITLLMSNVLSFEFNSSYDSTGWSGKINGDKNSYQKTLYQCAKNEGLSRDNFIPHNSAIGFASKKLDKKGISFLSDDGNYKFIPWDSLPKNSDKTSFTLGKYTFLGTKTKDGTWFFDDYLTEKVDALAYPKISIAEENIPDDLVGQLFGETFKSIRLLNEGRNNEKINEFSSSLIDCLRVGKFNREKDFISSLDTSSQLMTITNKKEIASKFETTKKDFGLNVVK